MNSDPIDPALSPLATAPVAVPTAPVEAVPTELVEAPPAAPPVARSRRPTPPPAPSLPAFFGLPSAASLMYLLSAACLLGGAAVVLSGPAADEGRLLERVGMIGTALVYQLAVLAVAVLVCRWKRGNDDAIALTVLLAALAGGGAATLDTIAYHRPEAALALGLGGAALAIAAGAIVARSIGGRWPTGLAVALIVVLGLDHLLPGLLGQAATTVKPDELLSRFALGWNFLLVVACSFVVLAMRARPTADESTLAVVERSSFRWILALIVLATSGLHQYLLAYALDLRFNVGDLLPMLVVLCAALDRLAWNFTANARSALPFCHAGLGLILVLSVSSGALPLPGTNLAPLPFWLIAGGLALGAVAIQKRHLGYALVGTVWLAFGSATLGSQFDAVVFRPAWAGLVLTLLFTGLAIWQRSPRLVTAACALAWCGATLTDPLARALTNLHLFPGAVGLGGAALMLLTLAALRPHLVHRNFQILAALCLAGAVMILTVPTESALYAPLLGGLVNLLAGVALAWRTRQPLLLIPQSLPLLIQTPMILADHLGWCAVAAAFLMLAGGAVMSWRNTRKTEVPS